LENRVLLRGKEIGDGFWDVVTGYPWPGNVRELLNMLKRAGIMLEGPITGEKLLSLLNVESESDTSGREDTAPLLREIREKIKTGENFWNLVWKPFIGRDIDRKAVKAILKTFYTENSSNFKKMIGSLNVKAEDYQKFMSLLYKYKIDPRKEPGE
jgi:DNA-binding NtrC family response regulator